MTDTEATPLPKQLCIACRTAIEPKATICPTCKLWQARWKNILTYYGNYVTAFAVILSGLTFVGTHLYGLLHHINKVEVLQFAQPGNQLYSNPGTSDVFLSHVETYWQAGNLTASSSIMINAKLAHGDTYYRVETEDETNIDQTLRHPYMHNATGDGTSLSNNQCYEMKKYYQRPISRLK